MKASFGSSTRMRALLLGASAVLIAGGLLSLAPPISAQRGGAAAAPVEHPIRLHRPHVVGGRARVEREGEKHIRLERQAQGGWETQSTEDVFVTLHAEQRVLAVTRIGGISSADYLIERLEIRRGTTRTTPLPRGTLLHAERATADATTMFMANGQPVDEDVADALSIVISSKSSEVTDDQVFGSPTPRRVGDRWPVADTIAEQDLARSTRVQADLDGNTQLVELATVNRTPCLVLVGTLTGRLQNLPNLPPTATFTGGTLEATQRGAFPVDGTSQPLTTEFAMTLDAAFSVAVPRQPVQRFRMQVRESKRETTRAVR